MLIIPRISRVGVICIVSSSSPRVSHLIGCLQYTIYIIAQVPVDMPSLLCGALVILALTIEITQGKQLHITATLL